MNTDLLKSLAQRLTHEPHLLAEAEDQMLRSLLLRHSTGLLDEEAAKEADALIASDSRAATIWAEFQATDEHLKTKAGKEWLSKARDRMLAHLAQSESSPAAEIGQAISDTFNRCLEALGKAITDLFTFRATLATASGEEGLKRKLADGQTQIAVHSDSAGRLWLRVTSTAEEFRNGSFKLDIEPAPAVLTFTEVEPGLYSARVCVDEEVAAELAKGAIPKLTPLPPAES